MTRVVAIATAAGVTLLDPGKHARNMWWWIASPPYSLVDAFCISSFCSFVVVALIARAAATGRVHP